MYKFLFQNCRMWEDDQLQAVGTKFYFVMWMFSGWNLLSFNTFFSIWISFRIVDESINEVLNETFSCYTDQRKSTWWWGNRENVERSLFNQEIWVVFFSLYVWHCIMAIKRLWGSRWLWFTYVESSLKNIFCMLL